MTPTTADPLLKVENLSVTYGSHHGPVHAVRNVSFSVGHEKVGIVGESGSGKSTIGRALLRILPRNAEVGGRLLLNGEDLLAKTERQMREIRGSGIAMVMQDPKYSLNPVMKVGDQVAETLRAHGRVSRAEARRRAMEMLAAVRIRDVERVYDLHPHEVSGGMGQRIMIAMMLVAGPQLIVADEPTSALDVTVQMQVLDILQELVSSAQLGLLFISHDLKLVSSFCDRVLIMYGGRIVEERRADELDQVEHPYARGLLESLPDIDRPRTRLAVLERCPTWLDPQQEAP